MPKRSFKSAWLLLIGCLALFAQLDRGSLTGTITDPSGAVIPDAKVTIKNTGTNAIYETRSNVAGQYTMPNLPVGGYEVTFEAPALSPPALTITIFSVLVNGSAIALAISGSFSIRI